MAANDGGPSFSGRPPAPAKSLAGEVSCFDYRPISLQPRRVYRTRLPRRGALWLGAGWSLAVCPTARPCQIVRATGIFSMTVLEVLQATAAYFNKRDIESPRLNAEHLLAHILKRKRIELYLEFERILTEEELSPLRDLVKRRGQGEPLQHLLGTVEFCGNVFLCDKRALVPRPETEQLVELLKSEIRNPKSKILDVGTGSGVIALSLAAQFPEATVTATDVSTPALELARENAERLTLSNRIEFSESDLLLYVTDVYDLIVANLPYIASADRAALSREVRHDPEVALFGGERGTEMVRKLIETAHSHLAPGGLLALEVGLGQAEELVALMAKKNYHDIEQIRDYSDVTRFLFGRYG